MIHAFHELKQRLAARDDSEHEQAALRIVIVGLVLGYMSSFHGSPTKWSAQDWTIILGLSGFFAVAIALFVSICLWPAKNVPRRLIGMLADNSGATWYMCLAGEYGFSMIGVLLFVTFGNGFRYGRRYLFGSQALALIGFVGVLLFVELLAGAPSSWNRFAHRAYRSTSIHFDASRTHSGSTLEGGGSKSREDIISGQHEPRNAHATQRYRRRRRPIQDNCTVPAAG